MPPVGDKEPSNESLESSSRRTRAQYNALPENLPGLKTRSGKQVKSPVACLAQDSSLKSTPKTANHENNNETCPDLLRKEKKANKSPGTSLANTVKKEKVKPPETDNVQHKGKTDSSVRELGKRKGQNDEHTRSYPQSKTSCQQDRTIKTSGKHSVSGENKSDISADKQYGKDCAEKESEGVAGSRLKKVLDASNRKAMKRKMSLSKDQPGQVGLGDIPEQNNFIKKAKYSEASEISSPRRSSRAVVPNRKFKDMQMAWDITAVKKEPISESPQKIKIKEEEKTVVRKVEVNSFAPGQLIKVTKPTKRKSKSTTKKFQRSEATIIERIPETHQEEIPTNIITPMANQRTERELEEETAMKTQTSKRIVENISTEIRPNATIKIQGAERTLGDAATDTPYKRFSTSVIGLVPEGTAENMVNNKSPTKSEVTMMKTIEAIDDISSVVQVHPSSKHVISLAERPKGRTVMKVTSKGIVLTNETEYSSLPEHCDRDPDNIINVVNSLEFSKVANQIADTDSNQVSLVTEVVTDTADMITEQSGLASEVLTIDLGSEQIEVHDVTDLVTDAAGCIDLKSSTELSDGSFSVETSEKISQILCKMSDTIVETADSAVAIRESTGQAQSNLPYRVIPTLNVKKTGFGRVVDLKENSTNSDTFLHGTIQPAGFTEGEKICESRTTALMHTQAKQPMDSLLKTKDSPAFSYVKEIVVETSSEKDEQTTEDPEYIIISVKKESDDALKQQDCEGMNNKSTITHESDLESSDEGSILNDETGSLEISTSFSKNAKITKSVQNTKEDEVCLETENPSSCSNSGSVKDVGNHSFDAEEQKQESLDEDLEHACSKSASTSTQTPLTDKADFFFEGGQGQSEMKLKTKTISVSVQKPGEELQVKDGEVTAEAQKQEFIIVHLPEGTTIKNYTVQSRNKIEDDIAFTQDDNGRYNCGECNYTTMKKANWYKHKRRHMGQCVKTHACSYCSYRASTSSNLKRHLSIHADIRMFKCGICELTFRQKIHLERHIKYRHEVKQVRCPLCDYVCANENPDLKVHIKRKHLHPDGNGDSVQAFTCSECGLTTLSRKDLRQHQKFHRKGPELKLFCEHCSFVTDCESRLKRHMYIHTKEKPFECSLCDYRGSQKEHVLRHMRAQHNIEIQRQSRKSFGDSTSNEDSNDGKDTEKNDKADYSSQEKIFACNHCTMKFAKLINLYKHLHSQHKDIMPYEEGDNYQCVVCDFTTNNKKNLLVHMRRHNVVDQSPPSHVYSCVLCRYINPKRRNLFQHMKKKHNIDIIMKEDGSASCFVTEDNPVVLGQAETSIQTVDNIFAGTDSPLQIVTDESASTSTQNVITIQDLAYAVSNPQLVNDTDVVVVEHGQETNINNIQLNSLVQHEAAEAIEGLQALAEQPGIFETQTVIEEPAIIEGEVQTTIEELQNVVDNSVNTKVELIGNSDMLVEEVGEKQILHGDAVEQIITDSKNLDASIQLSAEEVLQLTSGDYVEINGEMYKVEIRTDDTSTAVDAPGEEPVEVIV